MASVRKGPRRAGEVFAATLDLLAANGYDGLTVESVAARSGVNKTTIYRWWPSKDALLAAALVDSDLLAVPTPDTGSLRGDLLELAGGIRTLLTGERTAPVVASVLSAAPRRPELARLAHSFFADRLVREQPVFTRAVERGELPSSADPVVVMDVLAGAIWFRLLLRGGSAPQAFLESVVDAALLAAARR